MQRITDADGQDWDVTVGRGSWGSFMALFIPRGDGEVREAPLPVGEASEASGSLQDMSREDLLVLLEKSDPRTP
ncbi:MAG: hypothetical protein EA421_09230 [Gemmatimonadales bacterium]|nr:MAG: hypothetical protein EA421_09230 [Gemmatimonadales bacterium]